LSFPVDWVATFTGIHRPASFALLPCHQLQDTVARMTAVAWHALMELIASSFFKKLKQGFSGGCCGWIGIFFIIPNLIAFYPQVKITGLHEVLCIFWNPGAMYLCSYERFGLYS